MTCWLISFETSFLIRVMMTDCVSAVEALRCSGDNRGLCACLKSSNISIKSDSGTLKMASAYVLSQGGQDMMYGDKQSEVINTVRKEKRIKDTEGTNLNTKTQESLHTTRDSVYVSRRKRRWRFANRAKALSSSFSAAIKTA